MVSCSGDDLGFPHDFLDSEVPDDVQQPATTSADVAVSRSDYNRALFEARMSSLSDVELKLLWETGVMKQIFDSDDDSIFPAVVPPMPPEYLLPVSADGSEFLDADGRGSSSITKSLVKTMSTCHITLLQLR